MSVKKTFKRETALLLFAGLAWVVTTGDIAMVEVLVWPIFAFGLGAFGLDGYAKQILDKKIDHNKTDEEEY